MSLILEALKKNEKLTDAKKHAVDGNSTAENLTTGNRHRLVWIVVLLAIAGASGMVWWSVRGASEWTMPRAVKLPERKAVDAHQNPIGPESLVEKPQQQPGQGTGQGGDQRLQSEPTDSFRLPVMHFTSHVYSQDPHAAFVVINGVMAQAGDEVAPGVVLLAITPEGVEFSYQGRRLFWPALKDAP